MSALARYVCPGFTTTHRALIPSQFALRRTREFLAEQERLRREAAERERTS